MKVNPEQIWPEQPGGTRSHRGPESQNLYIKFRLGITRRMRKSEALQLLSDALRTGVVPDGIDIAYIDWESGREGKYNAGTIPADELEAMRSFYGAYESENAHVRAERVEN